MTITGGLRARLVLDSFTVLVEHTLVALGWLDTGRRYRPITFRTGLLPDTEPVELNTLVTRADMVQAEEIEMGSDLLLDRMTAAIDFYAEDEALGLHVTNDLRDALRGRLSVGALGGQMPIYDFRMATPAPVAFAAITDVEAVRDLSPVASVWARHLFTVNCSIEDAHY